MPGHVTVLERPASRRKKLTQALAAFDRLDPCFHPERTTNLRAEAFLDHGSPSEAARSLDEFLAKHPGLQRQPDYQHAGFDRCHPRRAKAVEHTVAGWFEPAHCRPTPETPRATIK